MASDLQIQGEVVVNSEQAEGAFNRVGDKATQMANEVATSAGKAGQAVDKIGDGAGASAEKFTRAESRISASIKRATNELELLGKTASQRLEFNIADKGLDAAKFEPALKKLREIEAQAIKSQRAATGSLDGMGMSAKATAAALRGIPAQFQDIVVSLQGGQAPMTVFLQQGSQLSGMFGGAGAAARAFGGYVLGLVNPFTIAAAAALALGVAYNQGSKEADGYAKSIALTGNAAGTTGVQLQQMAARISASVGTQGAAADALAQLVGTGKVAAQNLEQFAETAVRVERTLGVSIKDTVKEFAELGKAPVEASKKLNESYGYLTAAVFEQIKALDSQGRSLEAAALAQQSYDRAMTAATTTLEGRLGYIERAWRGVGDAAKTAWDKMLNIGRPDTLATQLESARANLERKMNTPLAVDNPAMRASREKGIESLRGEIALLSEQERVLKRGAEAQALRTQAEKDGIAAAEALQKTQDKGLTKQQQMNKALAEYRKQLTDLKATNPGSERLSPDAVARGESSIREQFKDKGSVAAINKEQGAYESLIATIRAKIEQDKQELAGNLALTDSQKLRIKFEEDLAAGKLKLSGAHQAVVKAALDELSIQEKIEQEAKEALKVAQARQALREKESDGIAAWIAAQEAAASSALASVRDRVKGLEDEGKALALSVSANISLAEAVERVAQARLLEKQQQFVEGSEGYLNIQKEIDARKELLGLISNNEANKKFLSDWKESVSKYDDIFRNGFADMLNNGKDGWKSFTKSLATTFKTTVADQLYKAFAQPFVVNIVGNLLGLTGGSGLAGVASAAAGGGSALGGIGNLASLGSNLFGGGLGSTISGAIGSGVGALFGTTAGNAALGTSLGLGAGSATAAATAAAQAGGAAAGAASAAATTGASIATAIPYFGAAIAALTLLAGSFKGETRYGGGFEVREGKALRTTGDVSSTLPEGAIVSSVQGTFDTINALYEKYGSQFLVTNIQAGIETSGKGRGGTFAGGLVSGGGATDIKFGDFFTDRVGASLNAEEAIKAFAGDLNKAVISALQTATDLPKFVQRQLEGIDPKSLGADKAAELLKTIGDLPNVLLQGFGTTRDALVQQFAQGLATGDATAAGQSVADTLVASIEASLYTDAAGKIFDIVNNGIVAPMLDAIATGASVSEALSQATIDKTIERAKSQASALAELFGNAEFTAALESIRTTVGDALGQAGGSFGYTPKFQIEAAQQIDVAAQSASTAAEEAARAWQDITDALLGDRSSAEIDLLRAQGKEEEALAAERARAIVGHDAYQVSLYDGTQAIFRQIEAIDKATEAREREAESVANLFSALDSSASRFLSGDALSGFQSTRQSDQLRGLGFDVSASQILGATTDQVKAFTLAVLGMDSVSNDAKTALLQLAGSILDTKESAQQTAQQNALQGVDTAFATLQRSVSLQRGVLSETATELKSVFDLLKTNVKDLYGEVDGAAQAQAAKARDFITKALGAARTTGYLPDSQELQDAIGSARSGLDATVYASQAEAEFQRLVLANELRDLQDISGDQLTEAEKQIKALDDILENAQTQVDALRSIDQSVLTVAGAIAALGVSISAAIGAGVKPGAGGTITAPSSGTKYSNSAVMDAAGYVQSAAAQGDLMGIYQGAKANGLNSADTAYLLQLSGFDVSKDDVLAWVKSQGLPSFAVGTNYVPKDMLAQIHKGEAIVPAAYNPAANPGMSASTARMENLLAEINAKLEELKGLQDEGNGHTGATRDLIDRVSAGGNSLAVDVMNQPTVEVAA